MKKILFFYFLSLPPVLAQSVVSQVPPSPKAAALGRYGEAKVDLSSGAINPSISLFNLNEYGVPFDVSLDYRYTGFRPSELSGPVGRGWNLKAGGVITRVINGFKDEATDGFYYRAGQVKGAVETFLATNIQNSDFLQVRDGVIDGEPDKFYFNFSNYSGSFFWGADGKFHLTSQQKLKIDFQISSTVPNRDYSLHHIVSQNFTSFTITTEDGTRYQFDQCEYSRSTILWSTDWNSNNNRAISAWYLSKITGANGQSISFEYSLAPGTPNRVQESYHDYAYIQSGSTSGELIKHETQVNLSHEIYLSSIKGNGWKIELEYEPFVRTNMSSGIYDQGKRVTSISMYNLPGSTSEFVKGYRLTYATATSSDFFELNELYEIGKDQNELTPYIFNYFGHYSQPSLTKSLDYFGYYNGKNNISLIGVNTDRTPDLTNARYGALYLIQYPTGGTSGFTYELNDYSGPLYVDSTKYYQITGGSVSSNPSLRVTDSITVDISITFTEPGGISNCDVPESIIGYVLTPKPGNDPYNLSDFLDILEGYISCDGSPGSPLWRDNVQLNITARYYLTSAALPGPGIRIASIVNSDSYTSSPPVTLSYEYLLENSSLSSGEIFGAPFYHTWTRTGWDGEIHFLSSNSFHGMSNIPVNYSRVNEKVAGKLRNTYYFTSQKIDLYFNEMGTGFPSVSTNQIGNYSDFSFMRGKPKKIEAYGDINLITANETVYNAKNFYTTGSSGFYSTPVIYTKKMGIGYSTEQTFPIIYMKTYNMVSYWFYSTLSKQINYDENGTNPVTSVTELFYDNAEHYQLSRKKHTNSDGIITEETFKYPLDYKTVSGKDPMIDSLINNHRINTVIERKVSSAGQVKDAVAYTFAQHTGNSRKPRLFLPDKEYRFQATDTFVPYSGQPSGINSASYYENTAFVAYDTLGQVLDIRDASGIHTSVIRAYRARYPVGVILNALKAEVDVALSQAGTSQSTLQNETNSTVIHNVITSLQGSMTTSHVNGFLFRPFIGMQRSILPNAVKTDYEYDSFSRLSGTKNHYGNWSNVYEYQLRGNSTSLQNQVVSRHLRIATTNSSAAANHLNATSQYEFFNAFGEPWQTMQWRQSSQAYNIVTESLARDNTGRVSRTYLPTSATITSSLPVNDMFTANGNFYGDYGYSTFEYRGSSGDQKLSRGPGSIWETNNKNTTFSFGTAGSSIRKYTINSSNDISLSGTYPAYTLTSNTVTDEQGNVSTEYKDKRGLLVERQTQINSGQWAVTHYIYDGLDRLRAVIQPEGFALNSSITSASTAFTSYVFCYEYDARGRTIRKHVPGAGWTEMVYDKNNRVVMHQDAYQKTLNKWNFIQYDAFGREVVKGETTKTTTQASAQSLFDAHGVAFEGRSGATYNGASFPTSLQPALNDKKLLNYYDDYTFLESQFAFNGSGAFHSQKTNIKGLLAGTKKKNSRDNAKLYTDAFYYDDLNRMIQSQHTHQLSSTNTSNILISNLEYNFAGEVVRKNSAFPLNTGTITLKSKTDYDHAGRVTATGLGINAEPSDILHYEYDEIGRLKKKKYVGAGSTPADPCDALTDGLVIGTWTVTGHPLVARYFHNKWWLVQRIGSNPDEFIVRGSEMISRPDVTLNNPNYASLVSCFEWKYSDFEGIIPPATPSVFPVPSGYSYVSENGEEFFRASSVVPCSTPATIESSVPSPAVNQPVTLTTSCSVGTPKWSTNATTNSITVTATASAVTYSVTCQGSSCTTSSSVSITVTGTSSGPCDVLTDGLVIGTWTITGHPLVARYFHNKWWLVQRIGSNPDRFIVRASEMIDRPDVTLNSSGYSSLVNCFEWQYSNYGGLEPPATPSVFPVPSGYSYVSENGEEFFQANSSVPCSTPATIVSNIPSPAVNQQVTLSTSCSTGTPKWSTNATTNSITVTATASAVTYSVTCQGSSCTTSSSVSITVTGTSSGPCDVLTDGLVIGTWTITGHPLVARYFHNKWWLVQRIGSNPDRFIVRASEMIDRPDVTLNSSGYSSLVNCFEWQYSNYGGLEPPATPSVFPVPSGYSYVSENGDDFFQQNTGGRIAAVDFTTGTEPEEGAIKLFPNPAGDRFEVKIQASTVLNNVYLSVSDMNGKIVYSSTVDIQKGENTYPIHSAAFSNGTYMVSLRKGLYHRSAKVVIMK